MNGMITLTGLLLTTLLWSLPETGLAGEISPQLEARIALLPAEEEINVLVSFADQLNPLQFKGLKNKFRRSSINKALRKKAKNSQVQLKHFLYARKSRNIKPFWSINAMAATVRAGDVETIAQQPGVSRVRLDGIITLPELPAVSGVNNNLTWNIEATGAWNLWQQGYDGSGVVVAIMDTGIDPEHQDLGIRWRGGSNSWYDPNGEHLSPYDFNGHGTQVTGVILGGETGGSAIGMAPGARWIGVKIFADNGVASYSAIHAGFQWLLDPDDNPETDDTPHLVNNSWGLDGPADAPCTSEFRTDIQILTASGISVNFSAGNTGPGTGNNSPANYPESFAAGGVETDLTVADFSSRGPSACDGSLYPAMTAPAVAIRTADLTFGGVFPENYTVVSGTSFAVPHITGAMALLKDASPWLSTEDLQLILTQSAADIGTPGPDNDSGYGLLNMVQALELLEQNTCTSPDGQFYFNINGCTSPSMEKGWLIPVIHLLLGNTTSHKSNNASFRSFVSGKAMFTQLISTHEGYNESTI